MVKVRRQRTDAKVKQIRGSNQEEDKKCHFTHLCAFLLLLLSLPSPALNVATKDSFTNPSLD